jgi:electron transfer flavoprotein beta subunit
MNIVVTVKQVIDPNLPPSYVEIDEAAKRIVSPFGVQPVMNGYDANALEAALRLKEQHGGRVAAICMGDESSRATLKRALAMGADAAVLLNDRAWLELDSAGVGEVIAAGIRKSGSYDLVLCGRQASDTDGGQVLYWIAERLGLTAVCPISKIEAIEDGAITVHRLTEDGYQRVRVAMPALLGVSSEINEPRMPSLKGTMTAGRVLISGWKAGDLGLAAIEPKVGLRKLAAQVRTSKAELIEADGAAECGIKLAEKLHAEGLI